MRKWVPGEGPLDARILIVGQSPGATEELVGRPFVGRAGKLLDSCLRDAGIDRPAVRLANVLPYRPVDGKVRPEEIKKYAPRLFRLVSLMPNLRVVVLLGNEALQAFTGRGGISHKRGEEISWNGLILLPTYHPAYVLRNPSQRSTLVRDLVRARKLADGQEMRMPAEKIVFSDFLVSLSPDKLYAVDVELDAMGLPRLVGVASSPKRVTVVPFGGFPTSLDGLQLLGHNLKADLLWMQRAGVASGSGRREDTMLMAHLLNENRRVGLKALALELLDVGRYWQHVEPRLRRPEDRGQIPYSELATYCAHDVAATLMLYEVLRRQLDAEPQLERVYRHISLPLADALLRVELSGVGFDTDAARRLLERYRAELAAIEAELPAGVNWASPAQVARVLYRDLGLVPPRTTEKTEMGATDEKALQAIRDAHPIVPVLLRWRKTFKRISMLESWIEHARDGRLWPTYNITGTATGRLSGSDPNPQNIPTDPEIRSLFVPPPGHVILSADYRMIELGVAAWIFQEATMLEAYSRGDDLHTLTATKLLGRPPADKEERKRFGKTPNFGLLYQQGDEGFREYAAKNGVDLTLDEARRIRAQWHMLYPGIREGWRRIGWAMRESGGVVTAPSGRKRRLPEFASGDAELMNRAWRQGCNFPVQCTAAELTHVAAILASRALYPARLVLHVHDALVFEVPARDVESAAAALREVMERRVKDYLADRLGVEVPIPLFAEIAWGPSWGEVAQHETVGVKS